MKNKPAQAKKTTAKISMVKPKATPAKPKKAQYNFWADADTAKILKDVDNKTKFLNDAVRMYSSLNTKPVSKVMPLVDQWTQINQRLSNLEKQVNQAMAGTQVYGR